MPNLSELDEPGQAQEAREAAAKRMQTSVQPPGGRQEGEFTQMALESTPIGAGIGAYEAFQKGNYPQAGLLAAQTVGPAASPLVRGAIRAAPRAAAALGGAAGATLLSSTAGESAKLTRAQQQQMQMEQERINAMKEAEIAKGKSEAEARRMEIELKSHLEQEQVERARVAKEAEEKKFQDATLREKYPRAATWLSSAGIALSAILPYSTRMQSAFRESRFFKDWDTVATNLEKAIEKGDQRAVNMYVNQAAEFKKQADTAQAKASQVTNWLVGALTPLELSMLPEQGDLIFGSERAKGKAEQSLLDPRRYMAGALQGGALAGIGVKTPVPRFGPNPQSVSARSAGLIKTGKQPQQRRKTPNIQEVSGGTTLDQVFRVK